MAILPKLHQVRISPAVRKFFRRKGILILISFSIIGIVSAMDVTSFPSVCGSCHEMKPEHVTWQASAHSQIACTNCHIEPGVIHLVQNKVQALNHVYGHLRKNYYLPVQMKKTISNAVCENCHTEARKITPSGDIKIPHEKHLARGIACIKCHAGVAHGTIAERQVTIDGNFARWTPVLGRQNMVPQYRVISMNICIDCHKENKAPLNCETCHKKIVKPSSHLSSPWMQEGLHGQEALKDVNQCNKCHSNTKSYTGVHESDPVVDYTRSNTYCLDCHLKKPDSHNQNWAWQHGARARNDQRGCLICHQQGKAKKTDQATATTCESCHGQPHPIPQFHTIPLPKGTRPGDSCYTCHDQAQCTRCHH